MAGTITIRKLVSVLVLTGADAMVRGLKTIRTQLDLTAKGAEDTAARVEKAAARMGAALGGAGGSGAGGRAGGSPRGGAGGGRGAPGADVAAGQAARSAAMQQGMALGAKAVNDATAALGRHATASERARAKVADLTKQIANNREAMAGMRRAALETGDADGTLAARMRGVAAETGIVTQRLAAARRELRAIDGGLIDAVKNAGSFRGAIGAASVALGNLAAAGVQRIASGVVGALGESAKAAMDFEKSLVDVAKVAKDADLTKDGLLDPRIKEGIKDVSRELGVLPDDVAKLTAQITAAFSGKTDIVALASDVTKIGVAWDITGQQAGEYFKQTSAGLQLTADETKSLFGTINQLGNELGVKSSEIAEAMTRSAGVLKGANLSGETGAALNATLIKAGASAEVAATGVRTFIARLGAGEAATDKQVRAFSALGLSAEAVAKNLSSGDAARAEKQIKEVVAALVEMGKTAPDKRMATLIELFGSESIGSIGAAASATENLAAAFGIAGDKGKALTSVQEEYDRVSNTTAARVDKLKAQVAVLAVEFGEALLPHIDKIVAFFQTPEGKEWGAKAVKIAAEAVTTFAAGVAKAADVVGHLVEKFGGATVAVAALGGAVLALAGPFAAAAAAGIAAGAAITNAFMGAEKAMIDIRNKAAAIEHAEHEAAMKAGKEAIAGQEAEIKRSADADSRREALAEAMASKLREQGVSENEIDRKVLSMRLASKGQGRSLGGGTEEDRLDEWGKYLSGMGGAATGGGDPSARFDALVAKRNASRNPLDPSEAKELRHLSKSLDRAIPKRPGGGGGHKATKMDRQLAAMDPSLRGLLRQGGESDAGGDLKVADNALDRGVFARATKGAGAGLGVGGVGSVGPGPNITTNDNRQYHISVQQQIDASSHNPAAENIRRAGSEAAQAIGGVVFTGASKVIANRNAGARLVP